MSSIKIKHSTIKFENMDKKGMFVNVSLSTKCRNKVDKNYDEIAEAWSQIAKSFRNLAGVSSGEVLDMFNRYINAAETRSSTRSTISRISIMRSFSYYFPPRRVRCIQVFYHK